VYQLRFIKKAFILLCLIFFSTKVTAAALVDIDVATVQTVLSVPAVTTIDNTVYSVGLYGGIDSKETFYFGAFYLGNSYSNATTTTTTTTFASTDFGVGLKWFMDKNHVFSMTAGYAYSSKGAYAPPGAASQDWTGSSLLGKLSMQPEFGKMSLGVSLLYYSATYGSKTIGTTTSSASNADTFMVPAISFTFKW
jgi:hypothetical protein